MQAEGGGYYGLAVGKSDSHRLPPPRRQSGHSVYRRRHGRRQGAHHHAAVCGHGGHGVHLRRHHLKHHRAGGSRHRHAPRLGLQPRRTAAPLHRAAYYRFHDRRRAGQPRRLHGAEEVFCIALPAQLFPHALPHGVERRGVLADNGHSAGDTGDGESPCRQPQAATLAAAVPPP